MTDKMLEGPVYIIEVGEWAIYIDDEMTGLWADEEEPAMKMYLAELATRRKHATRNPANIAPVDRLAGFTLSPEGASLAAADLAKSQKKIDQNAGMYQSSFGADPLNKNRKWQI